MIGGVRLRLDRIGGVRLRLDKIGGVRLRLDKIGGVRLRLDRIGGVRLRLHRIGGGTLRPKWIGNQFREAIRSGRRCQQRDVDAHGGWIQLPVSSQWKLNFFWDGTTGGVFGDTQQTFIGFPAQQFLLIDDLFFFFLPSYMGL
jgi:hypothetical protein